MVDNCEEFTGGVGLDKNQQCDNHARYATVLINNGKEFLIHRKVLLNASPFFENLLKSGMKEAKEGVIRLEMLTESIMKYILQFIYTGRVVISTQADAEDLMIAADYLLLVKLKTIARRYLEENLCYSNCISLYYFAKSYQFNELGETTRQFVNSNSLGVAESKDFLNLSPREVEKWISSDEIETNSEQDIFTIITMWVDQDRKERKGNFKELFRHVRLTFVSRDFLLRDIVTNDLVREDEDCVNRATSALRLKDQPPVLTAWPQSPRKAQESQGILICGCKMTLCYMPDSDKLYRLSDPAIRGKHLVLYRERPVNFTSNLKSCQWYDAIFNRWIPLNLENILEHSLAANTFTTGLFTTIEKIFTFEGDICLVMVVDNIRTKTIQNFLHRYSVDSNTWLSFPLPHCDELANVCFVSSDKFIYAMGGCFKYLTDRSCADASRYDMATGTWEEIADMQEARRLSCGVAAHGNIFIAGGYNGGSFLTSCEMYNVQTNEWCLIARSTLTGWRGTVLSHGTDLYLLGAGEVSPHILTVECYDMENNKWNVKTSIPLLQCRERMQHASITACSVRLFKGIL